MRVYLVLGHIFPLFARQDAQQRLITQTGSVCWLTVQYNVSLHQCGAMLAVQPFPQRREQRQAPIRTFQKGTGAISISLCSLNVIEGDVNTPCSGEGAALPPTTSLAIR